MGALRGPPIDAAFFRRIWIGLGAVVAAARLAAFADLPVTRSSASALSGLAFVTDTGVIVVGLASEDFAAHVLPIENRALAGAWNAAGTFGSGAAAGGLA